VKRFYTFDQYVLRLGLFVIGCCVGVPIFSLVFAFVYTAIYQQRYYVSTKNVQAFISFKMKNVTRQAEFLHGVAVIDETFSGIDHWWIGLTDLSR